MLKTPAGKLRARALGIPFDGTAGPLNSITDVPGIEVGYRTLVRGQGKRVVGDGPVRTGVTAIFPRGKVGVERGVFAGMFSLNGCGELTGSHWAGEVGRCEGPITLTNTQSVGAAHQASIKWMVRRGAARGHWCFPVVGETWDGYLNDIDGFHVTEEDVFAALDDAQGGAIEEGSVGGGTGMFAYGFKAGSGTASRIVSFAGEKYVVGAFVQSNFGLREQLVIGGVRMGKALTDCGSDPRGSLETDSSIIAVVATDAPMLPHQTQRLARRIALGIGRSGATSGHSSGDIFLAFSTANPDAIESGQALLSASFIPDAACDRFLAATVQAVDEAVLNSIVANETMTGADNHVVYGLPHDQVRALMSPR